MVIGIVGAGGHAKVVADAILAAEANRVLGFFDDDASLWGTTVLGHPVLGPVEAWASHALDALAMGIGDNAARKRQFDRLAAAGARLASVAHPRTTLGCGVELGEGAVVLAGVVVNADSRIGANSILNTSCTVDHDCIVGPHTHLAPGASLAGDVRLGEGVFAGIGAKILPGISVGDWAVIGAGAVVTRHVEKGTTMVGVPARVIRQ